jgi:tetratricopeptide (TPR) repeat protein
MIYEYKRVDKKKSCEYASRLLKMNPTNLWALFVLARNQKTPQEKIEKLKDVVDHHPKFARAVNEIGIVYGGTLKEYKNAIEWYTKATEITPEYASCYNNIGVNHELMKEYETALYWYCMAMEKDPQYKAPHANAIDCWNTLKFDDQQIYQWVAKYPKLNPFYFNYYIGLSYHDKKKYDKAIEWFNRALSLPGTTKDHHKVYNSMGISYDDMKKFPQAL